MAIENNRRIEIVRSQDEMFEKLELLQSEGYSESDIHVISKERGDLSTLNRHTDVSTHEAGSLMDTFKSWFTGESAVTEGLKKLDLSEEETDRYAKEVASGSIVLYTDAPTQAHQEIASTTYARAASNDPALIGGLTNSVGTDIMEKRFTETEKEPLTDIAKEEGMTPSTNEYVNETEGRLDEPQDRVVRGESFQTDPILADETNHIGHSMEEDQLSRNNRPSLDESLPLEEKAYGAHSPGADPNLGPAAFSDEEVEERTRGENEQDDVKYERAKKLEETNPMKRMDMK
jgi:hypothetical protein